MERAARETVEANKTLRVKAVRALTKLLYWITWDPHYHAASNYKFTTQQMILKLSWVWQHIPKVLHLQFHFHLVLSFVYHFETKASIFVQFVHFQSTGQRTLSSKSADDWDFGYVVDVETFGR
jgi:hypothetical protein